MSGVEVLLRELAVAGIRIQEADDRLRIEAPEGTLTPELRERIAKMKPELLALLRQPEMKCGTGDRRAVGGRLPAAGGDLRFGKT